MMRNAERVAAVAMPEAEGDGSFCNLRLSVTDRSQLLGDPTFDETDAKVGLPTVARSRMQAKVGGPEQRQLEPSWQMAQPGRHLATSGWRVDLWSEKSRF
jgi:hypothetical protein